MKNNHRLSILLVLLFSLPFATHAQSHRITKIWETDTVLRTPESVLYYSKTNSLFVSNIDGAPAEKDGKGFISKLGVDGKIIQLHWVDGLNAPKGMGIYKNHLYVADLQDIVVIDITKGMITDRIPVNGAVFLNDICIDQQGTVYVSDTRAGKVYQLNKKTPSLYLQNLKTPNGLLMDGNDLLILDNGSLVRVHENNQVIKMVDGMEPSTDGIEMVQKNEWIISSWAGAIYYAYANGNKEILLDTRSEKKNTADIGYDAKNKIIFVPTFYQNRVIAYQLQ